MLILLKDFKSGPYFTISLSNDKLHDNKRNNKLRLVNFKVILFMFLKKKNMKYYQMIFIRKL